MVAPRHQVRRHMLNLRSVFPTLTLILSAACSLAHAHPGGVDEDGCHVDAKTQRRHCHATSAFDPARPARPGDEGAFFGPLVSVSDGDTLRVKVQGVVMDVRLAGIDAPEYDQPYGQNAKQELKALIGKSTCVLVPIDTDRYGRTVAFVWVGDRSVNRAMVERGAAWFNVEFASDASLYDVEQEARRAKRGLWALPARERIEPWLWRRAKRK